MWQDNPRDSNSPENGRGPALAASLVITGQLRVYGFTVYSSSASSQYVLMFDASTLPADTQVPIVALPILANNQVSAYYGKSGRVFNRGIVLCNSTTDTTKTLGSANCFFDIQYDNLV
jgi:hypothetical protein